MGHSFAVEKDNARCLYFLFVQSLSLEEWSACHSEQDPRKAQESFFHYVLLCSLFCFLPLSLSRAYTLLFFNHLPFCIIDSILRFLVFSLFICYKFLNLCFHQNEIVEHIWSNYFCRRWKVLWQVDAIVRTLLPSHNCPWRYRYHYVVMH